MKKKTPDMIPRSKQKVILDEFLKLKMEIEVLVLRDS
jgi:hypothetical protein